MRWKNWYSAKRHQHGHDNDRNIRHAQDNPTHADITQRKRAFQCLRFMAPDHARNEADHEAQRDGQNDHGRLALAEQVAQDEEVQQVSENRHDADGQRCRDPERQMHVFGIGQAESDERSQHHEITLGEIYRLGCFVNQHEAKRDQAIDTAIRKAADEQLQNFQIFPPFRPCSSGQTPVR